MKHARQQIFTHVQSLLSGLADKIEIQTPHDVESRHSSHIDIHYTVDAKNLDRKTLDSDANDLIMAVVVTVKGYALTTATPQADDIAMRVELALSAEKSLADGSPLRDGVHTIAGATVDIDLDSTEVEQEVDQEACTARLLMTYSVFYRTEPGNPATLV